MTPATSLSSAFTGKVLTPESDGYNSARAIWNAMIDRKPALIAQCTCTGDVVEAVRYARQQNHTVSVRGGGHNVAGTAVCQGGLMIDLTLMKDIVVDESARTATAQPGLTWGEFDAATHPHGLATTGGAISTTGIAGLTLGGGLGWLMAKYGYVVDNLLSAEVVLADGGVVTANESSNPDLFWAIRGGGGNFGIVTSFTYRMHPLTTVLAGMLLHPLSQARKALQLHRDFSKTAPDELTTHAAILTLPDGNAALALIPVWVGDLREGEEFLKPLRAFGPPIADLVQPMPYPALQQMLDPAVPYGRHNYWKSGFIRDLTPEAIEVLVDFGERRTSPFNIVLIEQLHGAATRIQPDATAVGIRDECFHVVATAAWEGPYAGSEHKDWARAAWAALAPVHSGQVYANILNEDEDFRIKEAYGANYPRLREIKAKYDPANFFRVNQNISPMS